MGAAVSAAARGTATAAATGAGVGTHRTLSASCCGGAATTRARAHTRARARTCTSTRIRASYHATVCIHSSSERCAFQGGCPARVSGRSCSSRRGRHRSTGAGPRRDGPNANVRVSDRHQAGPRQAGAAAGEEEGCPPERPPRRVEPRRGPRAPQRHCPARQVGVGPDPRRGRPRVAREAQGRATAGQQPAGPRSDAWAPLERAKFPCKFQELYTHAI